MYGRKCTWRWFKVGLRFLIAEASTVVIDDFFKGLTSFVCCFTSPYYVVAIKISNQDKWFRELIYQVISFLFLRSWVGIYEQMETVLCKVAKTAIACKWVLILILFWGMFFLIRIDTRPEAFCPVSVIFFKGFCVWFINMIFEGFLQTYDSRVEFLVCHYHFEGFLESYGGRIEFLLCLYHFKGFSETFSGSIEFLVCHYNFLRFLEDIWQ